MENKALLAWYFPTTVLFIDDNPQFLRALPLELDTQRLIPKFFADPFAAKQFLLDHSVQDSISKKILSESEADSSSHQTLGIDMNLIHQEIYNPTRFEEISLVVVDYAMPKLNGLDFCRQIRSTHSDFKILMLTGEADDKLAVGAFNDGTIDGFIRKKEGRFVSGKEENFIFRLNESINKLQKLYFHGSSELALKALTYESTGPTVSCLNNPHFLNLFAEVCKKNNIIEHYLLDTDGSFLMLDYNGKPILFIVKNEQSMEDAFQVALNADELFPENLLKAMENREKILCLYEQDICDDLKQVKNFLHPAEKVDGDGTFYYAVVTDLTHYDINTKEIVSFKKYSENLTEDQ